MSEIGKILTQRHKEISSMLEKKEDLDKAGADKTLAQIREKYLNERRKGTLLKKKTLSLADSIEKNGIDSIDELSVYDEAQRYFFNLYNDEIISEVRALFEKIDAHNQKRNTQEKKEIIRRLFTEQITSEIYGSDIVHKLKEILR